MKQVRFAIVAAGRYCMRTVLFLTLGAPARATLECGHVVRANRRNAVARRRHCYECPKSNERPKHVRRAKLRLVRGGQLELRTVSQ